MQATAEKLNVGFQPVRISRSAIILLNARIDVVYPLFGVIREKDWAFGWNPEVLFSASGEMELHMMFRTPSHFHEEFFNWTVTQYRPDEHLVEYFITAEQRSWFVTVVCKSVEEKTQASVTYQYTGFTRTGHERNELAMANMFASDLSDWADAINYYLSTGKQLQ